MGTPEEADGQAEAAGRPEAAVSRASGPGGAALPRLCHGVLTATPDLRQALGRGPRAQDWVGGPSREKGNWEGGDQSPGVSRGAVLSHSARRLGPAARSGRGRPTVPLRGCRRRSVAAPPAARPGGGCRRALSWACPDEDGTGAGLGRGWVEAGRSARSVLGAGSTGSGGGQGPPCQQQQQGPGGEGSGEGRGLAPGPAGSRLTVRPGPQASEGLGFSTRPVGRRLARGASETLVSSVISLGK